ncbi:hypothetical protein [Actinophytocola gossypii]|uniref:Uncharacterized protein n=1 Tax=Actinophytocola gossypii TaxID=2812003 RepID=A0ABT2JFT3_9PSEU|nr:hypothetical protein [Actinophytocola gossypii]MCT2586733.1 hypothetical protein [Actinophytocola gossypii]
MDGFQVKTDALEEAATKFDGLAGVVGSAKNKLASDGDLPTLDPLSRAMAAAAAVAGGLASGGLLTPLAGLAGKKVGEAASGASDPYPGVRDAWLNALPRYQRMLNRDADELRKSSTTYEEDDRRGGQRFRHPMPRVPGAPAGPMPRVPGSPTVPMPAPNPNPNGNVPI